MANVTLEERVAALEAEIAELKNQRGTENPQTSLPWYEKVFGTFRDDPDYEEAMRLGREYRAAQRSGYESEAETI